MIMMFDMAGHVRSVMTTYGRDAVDQMNGMCQAHVAVPDDLREQSAGSLLQTKWVEITTTIRDRPAIEAPDAIEMVVGDVHEISGLPVPCTVLVDGETMDVDDGLITIRGDMEAEYDLVVMAWPHLDKQIHITVRAAT